MKLIIALFAIFALVGCGGSSTRTKGADYCSSRFLEDHSMQDINGLQKVDLDSPDKSLSAAELELDSAEIFVFDTVRDIRMRFTKSLSKAGETEYKMSCAGGTGAGAKMEPFTLAIPVVDKLLISDSGKPPTYSSRMLNIDVRNRGQEQSWVTISYSNPTANKQGSLKKLYEGFESLKQLYYFGNEQQVRNSMKLEIPSERNSSNSTVQIRTIQRFKAIEKKSPDQP